MSPSLIQRACPSSIDERISTSNAAGTRQPREYDNSRRSRRQHIRFRSRRCETTATVRREARWRVGAEACPGARSPGWAARSRASTRRGAACLTSRAGPPFRPEKAVDERVLKLPRHEVPFAQVAFALKAEPVEHADRRRVPGIDICLDAMKAERFEGELQQRGKRLSDESLPPNGSRERISDLGASVRNRQRGERAGADHAIGISIGDAPLEK